MSINELHIFDFDGTLFANPMPRKSVWKSSFGKMNQAWYQHKETLSCITDEMLKNDAAWNVNISEEIASAFMEESNIVFLMTGRKRSEFWHDVSRILASRGFDEIFSEIILKPAGFSTFEYKTNEISRLYQTYNPKEIIMWDDRINHVNRFNAFFTENMIPGFCNLIEWECPHLLSVEEEIEIGKKIADREGFKVEV